MNRILAMCGIATGAVAGAVLLAGGPAVADARVSIRPAAGSATAVPAADADFARVLLGPDDGVPRWTRVDRPDGTVGFGYGGSGVGSGVGSGTGRRCLDLSDPDDGGSAVVVRDCADDSLSQRWIRRGPELVNRDSGECVTRASREGTPMLVGAECGKDDPGQAWVVG